jgi:hypothetical protein
MKKIILFLMLLVASNLSINAKDYKVMGIKGKCEVQKANSWQSLKSSDLITSSSVIRGIENDVKVTVHSLGTNEWYRISLPKDSPISLEKLFSDSKNSTFGSFVSFVVNPSMAAKLSAQHTGQTTKGNSDFPCDSISASLFAKINGRFEVGKLTSAISDYDVYMRVDEITNISEKRFTIFNLSEDGLYIVILKVSKENPTNIHSFYENSLLKIKPNSVTELPETKIDSAFDYILLTSAKKFIIGDFINSIISDCDCTLKTDIPIGIYRVE